MYRTEFFTRDALDHLPRALDVVRKMGFRLLDLQVNAVSGGARVYLVFEDAGPQSATIFAERVAALRGVEQFAQVELAAA